MNEKEVARLEEKGRDLRKRFEKLCQVYQEWNNLRIQAIRTFDEGFGREILDALGSLEKVNSNTLAQGDEELKNIPRNISHSPILQDVNACKEAFRSLHAKCQTASRNSSRYSKEMLSKGSLLHQLKDDASRLVGGYASEKTSSIGEQFQGTRRKDNRSWDLPLNDPESTVRRFRFSWSAGLSKGIDLSWMTCVSSSRMTEESTPLRMEQENPQAQISERVRHAFASIQKTQASIDEYFEGISRDERRLTQVSEGTEEVFGKMVSLELCLKSNEIDVGVDDVIRHVLKLMTIGFPLLEAASQTTATEQRVFAEVKKRCGSRKLDELMKTMAFL